MQRIETEIGATFEADVIVDGDIQKFESLTGTELQYDTISFTVSDAIYNLYFAPADYDSITTSDNLLFLADEGIGWKYGAWVKYFYNQELIGKFYVENVKRLGAEKYQITGISSVGLLANSQHYGGVYNGITMQNLVEEIIGGQIPFEIDLALQNQPIYGWLPIATRRENLHQVIFAMSASIKKNAEGDMFITALSKDTATNIPDSRIFQGGSIDYPQASKAIALAEHAYIGRNDDEVITLYNSEIASDWIKTPLGDVVRGGVVLFDEPAHDLTIENATILESGVNYAVLSPTAECLLQGKRYTHTVRQVTRPEIPEEGTEEADNKVTVDTATLISVANSENVAERLAQFYGSAKKVKFDFVQGAEKTGDAVTFNDPFDEATEGLIASLDMKFSGILRATAEIIADYDPPDIGNYYNNVQILSGTDTFNIPQDTEKVRVVLIGGGSSGHKGADGESGYMDGTSAKAGKGGEGGQGGNGGKILIFTLETNGIDQISAVCGVGNTQGDGQEGTATVIQTLSEGSTVDSYTSADGTVSSIGFVEIFSGVSYGTRGHDGVGGSDGMSSADEPTSVTFEGQTWVSGAVYPSGSQNYRKSGSSSTTRGTYSWENVMGGGACVGSNGGDAYAHLNDTSGGSVYAGNGASCTVNGANGVLFGCGGYGGHGGGGGGKATKTKDSWTIHYDEGGSESYSWNDIEHPGSGGTGSNGGSGVNGCVVIYY